MSQERVTKLSPAAFERIRERIAHAENGWFFAQIADRVADRRRELGLSQAQLAELTGTTQSAVARLESGGRPPRLDPLLRIADARGGERAVELRPRGEGSLLLGPGARLVFGGPLCGGSRLGPGG